MYSVSVIIPAYNSERYIVEAVQSVFNQTYKDYEIIIVDDGSTDGTVERLRPYAHLNNFTLVEQANSGPSKARNQGIRAADGKYCAFLDSDDIMMPERLEVQVKRMEKRHDHGMIYSDLMTFNEKGIVHGTKKTFIKPYSGEVLEKLVLENFITTSTVMVRKECFEKVGLFDENMKHSEDYKMWLAIAKAYKIEYIDLPLIKYRYQPNSLSSNKVMINTSSYTLMKEFWEEHSAYKRKHALLYRKSMAHRLLNMGNAYYCSGRKSEASGFLMKSLVAYPFIKETYKVMTKMTINAFRQLGVKSHKRLYT